MNEIPSIYEKWPQKQKTGQDVFVDIQNVHKIFDVFCRYPKLQKVPKSSR